MSYATGEAAALTLLQALSAWDTSNSISLANDTSNTGVLMIGQGSSDHYLFLSPGPFESGYESINEGLVVDRWETIITLVVLAIAASGESPEYRLTGYRQDIKAALDQRFMLQSASVSMAKVVRGGEIQNWSLPDERLFITQELRLLWEEVSTITQND